MGQVRWKPNFIIGDIYIDDIEKVKIFGKKRTFSFSNVTLSIAFLASDPSALHLARKSLAKKRKVNCLVKISSISKNKTFSLIPISNLVQGQLGTL